MDIFEDSKIFLHAKELLKLIKIRKAAFTVIKPLNVNFQKSPEPIPFENRKSNLAKIKKGKKWGRFFDCAWFHFTSEIPEEIKGENLALIIDIASEGLVVGENNEALQGICQPLNLISLIDYFNITKGKAVYHLNKGIDNVDVWLEGGYNGILGKDLLCGKLKRADLAIYNKEIADYYFDCLALVFAKITYKGEIKKATAKALNSSYLSFVKGDISKAKEELKTIYNRPSVVDLTVTATGHSHLDLAWLWPIRETKRKAARTLSTALKNMSFYEDYIYGASQPQEFEWIKDNYPELYERLKTAAKEGRFEPQGGMWCESDVNLTGGESLIRQFLYGLEFWEKEFDYKVNNCWLPDVFGYSAALPQIIKKSGIDYFMTQKLSWNKQNEFPYATFKWQGLSEDQVLVHMLPAKTYNSSGAAPSLVELYHNHKQKDSLPEALMLYGAGDGGGGPCEANIELISRYSNLAGIPKIKFGKAGDFFERISKYSDNLPSYKGELYLETHQGTFTTQSNNKKLNREAEYALHDLEFLASYAINLGYKYPHERIKKIWKEILLYQFHDILPGSSIKRVHTESVARYKELIKDINVEKEEIIAYLSSKKGLTAINTSPYDRIEHVEYNDKWYLANVESYSSSTLKAVKDEFQELSYGDNYIENSNLKVTFNSKGEICSLIEKSLNKEFCAKQLNKLTVYRDKKLYFNAWDIDINYIKKPCAQFKLITSKAYIKGNKVVMENHYKFNKSEIKQQVVLKALSPYVEFDTSVDWHETHKMLRADFFPTIYSEKVTCDIQFGNIVRSTKTDNKLDWAQFEIPAHKYIDVSERNYGSAILSKSKYGFRAKDGLMSINLLRSPVYPDKTADRGENNFKYAYYPHKGNCFEAEVQKHSYLFNLNLIITEDDIKIFSQVKSDQPNVIIETIKPSEDRQGTIIRLYESEGRQSKVKLNYNIPHKNAYITDMRENILSEAKATIDFKPFEIKTIYLTKE